MGVGEPRIVYGIFSSPLLDSSRLFDAEGMRGVGGVDDGGVVGCRRLLAGCVDALVPVERTMVEMEGEEISDGIFEELHSAGEHAVKASEGVPMLAAEHGHRRECPLETYITSIAHLDEPAQEPDTGLAGAGLGPTLGIPSLVLTMFGVETKVEDKRLSEPHKSCANLNSAGHGSLQIIQLQSTRLVLHPRRKQQHAEPIDSHIHAYAIPVKTVFE